VSPRADFWQEAWTSRVSALLWLARTDSSALPESIQGRISKEGNTGVGWPGASPSRGVSTTAAEGQELE
jgi:hypothetical protein